MPACQRCGTLRLIVGPDSTGGSTARVSETLWHVDTRSHAACRVTRVLPEMALQKEKDGHVLVLKRRSRQPSADRTIVVGAVRVATRWCVEAVGAAVEMDLDGGEAGGE